MRTAGNGAVRANASGPDPTAAATAATPSAPSAMRRPTGGLLAAAGGCGGGRAGQEGRAEHAEDQQQPGVGQQERDAHQPRSADRGEREDGRVLPLGRAVEPPGPAEPLIGPDPLGDQPAARHHDQRGERARRRRGRSQQAVDRDRERRPHAAEDRADQHHARPDLRRHPLQDRDQVPGAEPPAPGEGLLGGGGTGEQHHARHQGEPGKIGQTGAREDQHRGNPAGQERQPSDRVPERPGEHAAQPHASIVRRMRPSRHPGPDRRVRRPSRPRPPPPGKAAAAAAVAARSGGGTPVRYGRAAASSRARLTRTRARCWR